MLLALVFLKFFVIVNASSTANAINPDASGRIIASQDSLTGHSETFAYDAAANLLDGPVPGAGLIRHNQLLTYQDKRYRYDAFGRTLEKRSIKYGLQRFAYDADHRLIEVRTPNGHCIRMAYDPLGRRVGKTEHSADGVLLGETRFTWDGLRLLQEHRNNQISLYLYADDGYEPLARVDGTGDWQKIRYYHNDLNGLPEQLTESDGHPVWRARYKVWGNTHEETREPYFAEEQNLRFQGQYLDRETGLHFNTFRFYDPDIGRFTTPDPIGLAGGINLYAYAPNPVGWVDPLGLSCTPNKKTSYQAKSRRDAFRQAKRDAGIPTSQRPLKYEREDLYDDTGKKIMENGRPITTRNFLYANKKGEQLIIQEHSFGHAKATKFHGAEPHFNVRPAGNPGTGSVPGTHGHYNF